MHTLSFLQEQEIDYLKEQIVLLRKSIENNVLQESAVNKEEFLKLEQENIKLKHRIAILKRVC